MGKRCLIFILFMLISIQTTALSADKINMLAIEDGGSSISFTMYDFDGSQCIQLTDAAKILSGSSCRFNISDEDGKIFIKTGEAYSNDKEIKAEKNNKDGVKRKKVKIDIDGEKYTLKAYLADGAYYFKLSDLQSMLGYSVGHNYKISGTTIFDKSNNVAAVMVMSSGESGYNSFEIRDGDILPGNYDEYVQSVMASKADPSKPMLALTFDDGPQPGSTDVICQALKSCGGRATFFVVGSRIKGNEDIIKMIDDTGSQIGNHSFTHAQLSTLSIDKLKTELNKTSNAVYDICGKYTYIGRPTYGSVSDNVRKATSIEWFNWSVDTLDWKYRDADYVYKYITQNVSDGDVVLLHDLHKTTGEAMAKAIPELAKNYQLVTIDELAAAKGGYENIKGYIRK